jgi:hypothetical protein
VNSVCETIVGGGPEHMNIDMERYFITPCDGDVVVFPFHGIEFDRAMGGNQRQRVE